MRVLGTLLTTTTVLLAGWAAPAQAAEGTVLGVGAAGAIPGQYIVGLKGDLSGYATSGVARTYTATMSAKQARRLAADPGVRFVEQDRVIRIAATQGDPGWGLDRIDQRAGKLSRSYTPTDDGSAVHAYVVDTGIRISHREFGGRAGYGYDALRNGRNANDCNGHGTHVAGTIGGTHFGVAKNVQLVAVRVLDCNGEGTLSSVLRGINWVTANAVKPAVANMSLGGDYSPSINAAVQRAINSGVTFVVAAGNENRNAAKDSPASVAAAITVGATDVRDRRASFSNYGPLVDIFAPGVNIRSAYIDSNTGSAVESGTSMASPHVAGAAALALDANPAMTPAQVRNFLVSRATAGRVADRKGSANKLLFVPAPPARPVITSAAVTMTAGEAYEGKLTLAASRRGAWSLASGTLPAGLSLSAEGVLSGTPAEAGETTVTVRFVDFVPWTVTRAVTITVQPSRPANGGTNTPGGTGSGG